MALSSLQLEAFHEVAKTLSFSQAARNLHITQSALSQRVINLEQELELSLFVRDAAGVRLTDSGHALLRHCQTRMSLELELLEHLGREKGREIGGTLRVGGFSSVMHSVILPALSDWIRRHPAVQVEFQVREMRDLPLLLKSGEVDFAILDHDLERSDLQTHVLGHEELVLVESARHETRSEIYLDHDPDDLTTERYFQKQGKKIPVQRMRRSYLDDIHGLIEGVALGWGRAVIPRHLIEGRKEIRLVPGFKPVGAPVVLHHYIQPYYTRMHHEVSEILVRECAQWL